MNVSTTRVAWAPVALATLAAAGVAGLPGRAGAVPVCFGAAHIRNITATVTCVYGFTGAEQTFVVPSGVYSVRIVAIGAAGGSGASPIGGGLGGGGLAQQVIANVAVYPRATLYVEVGGTGGNGTTISGGAGGFNGGAAGADSHTGGGAGGGASDVRQITNVGGTLSSRLVVAGGGGGGGGGGDCLAGVGGSGGNSGAAAGTGGNCIGVEVGGTGGGGGGGGLFGGGGGGGAAVSGVPHWGGGGGGGGGSSGTAVAGTSVSNLGTTTQAAAVSFTFTQRYAPARAGARPAGRRHAARVSGTPHITAPMRGRATGRAGTHQRARASSKPVGTVGSGKSKAWNSAAHLIHIRKA